MRILYLEDDFADVQLLRALCEEYCGNDCQLVHAANRREFEAAVAAGPFHGVLSDSGVPGLTGGEALRLVRDRLPGTPFVYFCGVKSDSERAAMAAQQPDGMLSKDELTGVGAIFELFKD